MIDADGLFGGERLAACSDLAQLFWPRLYLASNGYARLELSFAELSRRIFSSFKSAPTENDLWTVVEEYVMNYLAVVYQVDGGSWWLQFITSEKFLPRYKTTRDERSPAPPPALVEKQREGYIAWKKSKSLPNQRFQKFAENSGDFSKVSAVVVVEGVVEVGEEKSKKLLLDTSSASSETALIYEAYPRKVGRKKALQAIDAAARRLVKGEAPHRPMSISSARELLKQSTVGFARSDAGRQGKYTPHPATWFGQSRYLDDPNEWNHAGEIPKSLKPFEPGIDPGRAMDTVIQLANAVEALDPFEQDVESMLRSAMTAGIFKKSGASEDAVRELLTLRHKHRKQTTTNTPYRPQLVANGSGRLQ